MTFVGEVPSVPRVRIFKGRRPEDRSCGGHGVAVGVGGQSLGGCWVHRVPLQNEQIRLFVVLLYKFVAPAEATQRHGGIVSGGGFHMAEAPIWRGDFKFFVIRLRVLPPIVWIAHTAGHVHHAVHVIAMLPS